MGSFESHDLPDPVSKTLNGNKNVEASPMKEILNVFNDEQNSENGGSVGSKIINGIKNWLEKFESPFAKSVLELFESVTGERNQLASEVEGNNSNFPLSLFTDSEQGELELLGRAGKENVKIMVRMLARKCRIPEEIFYTLIKKESDFDINARPKNNSSTAFSLSQMLDDTWEVHGKGLDRNNPFHNTLAAARYLAFIKEENNCSWEEATAFYNTGENFKHDSEDPVSLRYLQGNLESIAWNVPGARGKTAEQLHGRMTKSQYFQGAVTYYSGTDYKGTALV